MKTFLFSESINKHKTLQLQDSSDELSVSIGKFSSLLIAYLSVTFFLVLRKKKSEKAVRKKVCLSTIVYGIKIDITSMHFGS